jgi:hypothetical protein
VGELAGRGIANSPAEGADEFARTVDANRRRQDQQIDTGRRERRKLLAAARNWADQANRVKQAVAQRVAAGALFRLRRLFGEAAAASADKTERS